MKVRAYGCRLKDQDPALSEYVINTVSAGKARYSYLLHLQDAGWVVNFFDIAVRSLGEPVQTPRLDRIARYRSRPELTAGTMVNAEGFVGAIVDADSSCNFQVLVTEGPRRGSTIHCHPCGITVLPG